MEKMKNIACMMAGAVLVLGYQKYSKRINELAEKSMDLEKDMMNDMLGKML